MAGRASDAPRHSRGNLDNPISECVVGERLRRRVCLVFPHRATFVQQDQAILAEANDVETFEYRGKADLFRLMRAIWRCDVSYSWFALGHATAAVLLSKLFRRRSIVVVGGWDVVSMPEIPYGAMLSPDRRRKTAATLRRADVVLAVSESIRRQAARWVDREIAVVPLGVDVDFFSPGGTKEPRVVTVAGVTHEAVVRTKGLDVYFEVARRLKDVTFEVIGRHAEPWPERLRANAPPNVELTGWLPQEALRDRFRRASVYAQLSAQESFGLSLAEAMACGCAPVVSDRGALPEVVGSAGAVVPYGDADAAADAVQQALPSRGSSDAQTRIADAFPLARRRERLLRIVEGLR